MFVFITKKGWRGEEATTGGEMIIMDKNEDSTMGMVFQGGRFHPPEGNIIIEKLGLSEFGSVIRIGCRVPRSEIICSFILRKFQEMSRNHCFPRWRS